MAEHLDDLLAGDHFFDVAIDIAQRLLLGGEILGGVAADLDGDQHHGENCQDYKNRQNQVVGYHGDKDRQNGHQGRQQLGNTLGEHLAQGVGVVGVVAHGVAEGVGIKIPDGKGLHVSKHIIPDIPQNALRDGCHDDTLSGGGHNADSKQNSHFNDDFQQTGEIGGAAEQHGLDVIIDDGLHHGHGLGGGEGGHNDADRHHDHLPGVGLQGSHKPLQGVFLDGAEFYRAMGSSFRCGRHISRPPFWSESRGLPGRYRWSAAAPRVCRSPPHDRRPVR